MNTNHLRRFAALLRDGATCGEAAAESLEEAASELDFLQQAHRLIAQTERGECWHWQGDGHDFPESLVCPVVIDPELLRGLLRDAGRWQWWRENVGRVIVHTAVEESPQFGSRRIVAELTVSDTLDILDAASVAAATDAAMRNQFAD